MQLKDLSICPSSHPHFPVPNPKLRWTTFAPLLFSPFTILPHEFRGRGYLPSKVGNMGTSQKAFRDCYTLGRWHSRPPCAPHFILEAFGPTQEPKRTLLSFAFSAASLFPSCENNIPQKESRETSCPFVRFLGQRCCLLHSTAWLHHLYTWTLFDGKCFIFTNVQSGIVSWLVFDQLPVYSM